MDAVSAVLEEASISYERGREDTLSISMQSKLFADNMEAIRKLVNLSVAAYRE